MITICEHFPTDRIEKVERIGHGTYGRVYKVLDKTTGQHSALKHAKVDLEEDGIPSPFLREIVFLKEFDHPNLIRLQEVILTKNKLYLRFDLMECDLKSVIQNRPRLPEVTIVSLMKQILSGLDYMHDRKTVHRDLKPGNILFDSATGLARIADFGLTRAVMYPPLRYSREIQTLWYRAPEIIAGKTKYGPEVDIWSVGCILYELYKQEPLFAGTSAIDQLWQIFQKTGTPTNVTCPEFSRYPFFSSEFPKFPRINFAELLPGVDARALSLIEAMTELNPTRRITVKGALAHAFFEDLRE